MTDIVNITYKQLIDGDDLSEHVFKAYGVNGLGVITISDIPEYEERVKELLPLSHKMAHLSEEERLSLERPETLWNAGWSHGKEKLGDVPDFSKGSFYANPLYDRSETSEDEDHPYFNPPNIWPTKELPELENAFKRLGKLMFDVTLLWSKHVDSFVSKHIATYDDDTLYKQLNLIKKAKGRLLYYYPTNKDAGEDDWIGWHNDSGFLTALTTDMFFDDDTGTPIDNPDKDGGLWIVDRVGGNKRVHIPHDRLAIQCGECLQIITGGMLVATPHSVRASRSNDIKVGRASFPLFVDVNANFLLSGPKGIPRDAVFDKTIESKVPTLRNRWLFDGMKFVDFLGVSFEMYYEWNKNNQARK